MDDTPSNTHHDAIAKLEAQLAELQAKQEKELQRLRRLLEVSLQLNSTLNLSVLLELIQQVATDLTNTEGSAVILIDEKNGNLYFEAATGEKRDELRRITVPIEGSIAGEVLRTGEPLIVPDASHDPRHYEVVDQILHFNTRNILAVPLMVRDQPIGALEVINKRDGEFNEEDLDTILTLACHAAVAITNARLFQQNDMVSEVVHELRTPMTSIIGYSKMLSLPGINEEMKNQFAETILREATRLGQMVNDFLEWTRLEAGRIRLEKEPVELNQIVKEVVEVILPQADERQISIEQEIPAEPIVVIGDRQRIKQIVLNLASNAVKYNREEGKVVLTLRTEENDALISVQDTGPGIPEESLPHLFERFYRVPGTEDVVRGSGLGLVIAKKLAEAHDGTIEVESQVGEGSTFIVRLPLANDAPSA